MTLNRKKIIFQISSKRLIFKFLEYKSKSILSKIKLYTKREIFFLFAQ